MCGVVGFLQLRDSATPNGQSRHLRHMMRCIVHRGPDSDGTWVDGEAGIWIGHRRLAIVDLSAAGAQPMVSEAGRYVIAFNGEIYNHADLRAELERSGMAPAWRGHSDTETLLAGFDAWGIEETIRRSVGMFAFAVWDRRNRALTLGRDRIGEKPLYYGVAKTGHGPVFLFGSELKALREHPAFARTIDRNTLSLFLRYSYIGGSHTIYEGCHKVLPGCLLSISRDQPDPHEWQYWSAAAAAGGQVPPTEEMGEGEAVDALESLLSEAVGRQMVADVPVGAFLSGGIDSSTVVALMRKWTSRPVHTFSIGFRDPRHNEAEHAKRVAAHLGTRHTELYVDTADLLDVVPALARIYDEPFGDNSQIPTILVARLARQHVTVALSGDGGDELFCGYDRYRQVRNLWHLLRPIPPPARAILSRGTRSVAVPAWNALAAPLHPKMRTLGQRLGRIAAYLEGQSAEDIHRKVISFWPSPPVVDAREPP